MSEQKSELQLLVEESGLEESKSKEIIEAFGGPFKEAGDVLSTFVRNEDGTMAPSEEAIKVTDESDSEGMDKARKARLILKNARTTIEKNRKALKEDINKQGRAIDKIANFVKSNIQPAEEYLQLQENFAKVAQEKRDAEKKAKRLERLSGFEVDTSIYNIDLMTDEAFESLVSKLEDEAKRAEEERLALEKKKQEEEEAEKKRQAEIKAENDRLKAEAEEKEKANAIIRDRVNKITALGLLWDDSLHVYKRNDFTVSPDQIKTLDDSSFESLLNEFTEKIAEEIRIEKQKRDEAEAQAKADRLEKERLQKIEDDRLAAEAEEKRVAAERERQSLLAPDKEKVSEFLNKLQLVVDNHIPAVKDKEAFSVLENVQKAMKALIETANEQVEKL